MPLAPLVLVHGAADDIVPAAISRSYAEHVAPGAQVPVSLREVSGCEHFGLIDPEHPAFAEVLAAVSGLAS
jgi:pimeloyl-ACP methyl ester carboxylesterase